MSVIELVRNYTTYIQIKWSYYRGGLCHPTNPSSGFPHYLLYAQMSLQPLLFLISSTHAMWFPSWCVCGGKCLTHLSHHFWHMWMVQSSAFSSQCEWKLLIMNLRSTFFYFFFLFPKTFLLSCHQFSYIYNPSLDSSVFLRECLHYFSTNLLIFHMSC